MIIIAGDSFSAKDYEVTQNTTWHHLLSKNYNIKYVSKRGTSNVDIWASIKDIKVKDHIFVVSLSHLNRAPEKVLKAINPDCDYEINNKIVEEMTEIPRMNFLAAKKIKKHVEDRGILWTPFFGYENEDYVVDLSVTLAKHNEMWGNENQIGNHLDQIGHTIVHDKIREFINGIS
tara:strand:- start:4686 stop:5210 length:525 start_codon:yes stop_codon:yes gene_type:complete